MTLKSPIARAAITNITPNHLDWHRNDMEEYISAKCNIFGDETLLVLNAENDITKKIAEKRGKNMVLFSSKASSYSEIVPPAMKDTSAVFVKDGYITLSNGSIEVPLLKVADIKLPGKHNLENYMTAIALTSPLVDKEIYTSVAKSFSGVPHRLEPVRELDGVFYYNGSIDSSPTRTAAALSAIKEKKVVICGGYDKHIPFSPLADALCENNVRAVILTGATAQKIKSAILECEKYSPEKFEIIEREDFDEAVLAARNAAKAGDCVLLSPACASFDRFKNFETRGEYFKMLVNSFWNRKINKSLLIYQHFFDIISCYQ
jgi:UDP-N-acetylmuramoylalanine--D-glutamate ligase